MAIRLGYLLPTRERVMAGVHETREILDLAAHAEDVGLDSVWLGDSLLAKPRHDPLTLVSAIAGCTRRVGLGTAVLLPMLRNPVLLAHQLATIDRVSEGRFVVGIGIARDTPAIRNEFLAAGVPFEKRVGTMMEGVRLCRALWSGDKVDWDGRWTVRGAELAPTPFTPGGPRLWAGGGAPQALERAGKSFDGWFPSGPGAGDDWGRSWERVRAAASGAGREPDAVVGAAYVTVAVDDDRAAAEAELDDYLERYYLQPAAQIRGMQYTFAGREAEAAAWLKRFADAGASHLCVRFTGPRDREQMETLAAMRRALSS